MCVYVYYMRSNSRFIFLVIFLGHLLVQACSCLYQSINQSGFISDCLTVFTSVRIFCLLYSCQTNKLFENCNNAARLNIVWKHVSLRLFVSIDADCYRVSVNNKCLFIPNALFHVDVKTFINYEREQWMSFVYRIVIPTLTVTWMQREPMIWKSVNTASIWLYCKYCRLLTNFLDVDWTLKGLQKYW